MLVADMRERMTSAEWMGWWIFYQRKAQRQELANRRG